MRTLNPETSRVKTYLLNVNEHYKTIKRIVCSKEMSYEEQLKALNALVHLKVKHEEDTSSIDFEKVNLFALLDVLLEDKDQLFY